MTNKSGEDAKFLPACQEAIVAYAMLFGLILEHEDRPPASAAERVKEPAPVFGHYQIGERVPLQACEKTGEANAYKAK